MKRAAVLALVLVAGCYDSLVSDTCAPGLVWAGAACVRCGSETSYRTEVPGHGWLCSDTAYCDARGAA